MIFSDSQLFNQKEKYFLRLLTLQELSLYLRSTRAAIPPLIVAH